MRDSRHWSEELRVLAESGWLSETPGSFRDAVLSRCSLREYGRSELIYRQGDSAGALFGLIEGGLGVEIEPEDRRPYLWLLVGPGFWCGESSLITRRDYVLGLRCLRDARVAYLPMAEWDAIHREVPDAWRWLGLLAVRNCRVAIRVADALLVRGSTARLAAVLVVIATAMDTGGRRPPEFAAAQEQLASMTNLSRSTVERTLARFEAEGLIERSYRRIVIRDLAGLGRYRMENPDL